MARILNISIAVVLIMYLCSPAVTCQQHKLTQLTFSDSTHDGYPYWSPDGEYILYSSGTASSCMTMKIPTGGGNPELVTEIFAQHARWSPAGDYIAFDGDFGTKMQVIPSTGGTPIRIDPDSIPIYMSGMPCWSPDGRMIAFKSMYTIYIMDLETGDLSSLYRPKGKNAVPYDWTPDGNKILVDVRDTVDRTQSDIWEVPLSGLPRQITFLPGRQVKPSISPDGSRIVFTSNHGGNADLWIMPATGGDPVQLTFYNGNEDNPGLDVEASWSPDGKSIAFSSTRNDMWAIWKMDLDQETIREKLNQPMNYSVLYPTIDTGTIPVIPFILNENPLQPSPAVSWDRREFVLVKTGDDRYAWFDATAENGDTLNYKKRMQGKGNQVIADKADFPTFASSGLHSEKEIRNTRSITGRSVSRITVDGRPGGSSGAGFLAADETILSVIISDNRMVQKLGLKHPDLARPLLHLWNISNTAEKYNEYTPAEERIYLKGLFFWGKEIGIKISGGRGWQESIFNDEILGSYHLEAWRDLDPGEEEFLKAQYGSLTDEEFETLKRKISSLHTGEMVPYYINRYGFYEGHTDFRAEPIAIAFIFGIRSIEEIHQACGGDLYTLPEPAFHSKSLRLMKAITILSIIALTLWISPQGFSQERQPEVDSLIVLFKSAGRDWNILADQFISIGEPAVLPLINLLQDSSQTQWVRRTAAMTLNDIHSPTYIEPALRLLLDRDEIGELRNQVTNGLKGHDLSHASDELWKIYQEEEDPFFKLNIAGILDTSDPFLAYQAYEALYTNSDGYCKQQALKNLVRLSPEESTEWYLSALQADDWMTANLAMDSLVSTRNFIPGRLIRLYHRTGTSELVRWRIVHIMGHRPESNFLGSAS